MDPSGSSRNSPSYLDDYSTTGYRYQSQREAYEVPYDAHLPPQSMLQNYQGYFPLDSLSDSRDIHVGRDESALKWQRRYYRDQKPNYSGRFTAGKSSRFENGSGHDDDDGSLRDRCSIPHQENETEGKFIKELSENASEDKTRDFSRGNDVQRKRRNNKKTNKSFNNLSGPERSGAGNWRNGPGVYYSQNFNEHDRQNGYDGWSRSYDGSRAELGPAINRYEHGYRGRGRNNGRRRPENYVESCDYEDWENMPESRDYRNLHVEAHREASRETGLFSLPSAKESLSNRQLELPVPVDSCGNLASSRSSASYQETGARPKSGSFIDRKSHSRQDFENSDKLVVQNLSRTDRHYERKSQVNRNFSFSDDGNGISQDGINRNGFSIPDRNSPVCDKQTRVENSQENFSDRRKGRHSKLTANRPPDSSGKPMQKKSESQDANSISSGYQSQSKANWNANRNQRQQRRNNERGSKNRPAEDKQQSLQDKDTERVSYRYKNLDNRPGSAVDDTNADSSDSRLSLSCESNCLGAQKTDESDGKRYPESRNRETISSKEKDSVLMKGSTQRLKDPSSGQRRDLPPATRWQDETQRGT